MSETLQIADKATDPYDMLVDIGRQLQAEDPDLKGALALIRPALRELSREREAAAQMIARYKMMQADNQGVQPIMPRSPAEAWEYANMLCQVGHVPSSYREGQKKDGAPVVGLVVLGIMKAMEIGVPPQTGLGNLMPINDRFSAWGDLCQALVQRQGVIEAHGRELLAPEGFDITQDVSNQWPATVGYRVWFKRRGDDGLYEHTYTVGHARRAKLWMNAYKKPWLTDPDRMLFNRARAFALRDGFSDCLFGLAIREEIEDQMELDAPKQIATDFLSDDVDLASDAGSGDEGK